jgi:hypothetical protein
MPLAISWEAWVCRQACKLTVDSFMAAAAGRHAVVTE